MTELEPRVDETSGSSKKASQCGSPWEDETRYVCPGKPDLLRQDGTSASRSSSECSFDVTEEVAGVEQQ